MRLRFIFALVVGSVLGPHAFAQGLSDETVADVLKDFSEYCVDERERQELSDPDSADVILKPGAITSYSTDHGPVTILDAGSMRCESGGYGYCGVSKCTAWLFHSGKSQAYLGTLVVQDSGSDLQVLLCEGPDPYLDHCRKIDLDVFRR